MLAERDPVALQRQGHAAGGVGAVERAQPVHVDHHRVIEARERHQPGRLGDEAQREHLMPAAMGVKRVEHGFERRGQMRPLDRISGVIEFDFPAEDLLADMRAVGPTPGQLPWGDAGRGFGLEFLRDQPRHRLRQGQQQILFGLRRQRAAQQIERLMRRFVRHIGQGRQPSDRTVRLAFVEQRHHRIVGIAAIAGIRVKWVQNDLNIIWRVAAWRPYFAREARIIARL
ncbi:hypothetical protein D9M73_148710 [compost metagenome]